MFKTHDSLKEEYIKLKRSQFGAIDEAEVTAPPVPEKAISNIMVADKSKNLEALVDTIEVLQKMDDSVFSKSLLPDDELRTLVVAYAGAFKTAQIFEYAYRAGKSAGGKAGANIPQLPPSKEAESFEEADLRTSNRSKLLHIISTFNYVPRAIFMSRGKVKIDGLQNLITAYKTLIGPKLKGAYNKALKAQQTEVDPNKEFKESMRAKYLGSAVALSEGMKSQKQLFSLLDEFFKTKEYTTKQLNAKGITNETYGKKSMIYVTSKSSEERNELESFLTSRGVKVHKEYHPGSPRSEIQVSYFKGNQYDESKLNELFFSDTFEYSKFSVKEIESAIKNFELKAHGKFAGINVDVKVEEDEDGNVKYEGTGKDRKVFARITVTENGEVTHKTDSGDEPESYKVSDLIKSSEGEK